MAEKHPLTKMPELMVFAKAVALGLTLSEIFRITYIGGHGLVSYLASFQPLYSCLVILIVSGLLATYAKYREIASDFGRLYRSYRIDLLLAVLIGACAHYILMPVLQTFHKYVETVNPLWTLLLASFLLLTMLSSLVRALLRLRKNANSQLFFLADTETSEAKDDLLGHQKQATQFAEMVLASGSSGSLVFGIDAPWGIGKTSFINLASKHWQEKAANEVIVFRFEPLRYASDPDLADKFIRDLSAEIQRQVFVPEFPPAVTRYSQLLKGPTTFSFLGFRFTLNPPIETIDELLDDIDDALIQIRRRLIVVIDDLDRLDAKAVNNILFTAQRTFKLTQSTYILCYDTEILVSSKEESEKARQFLEKFVNVKVSLFVDSSALVRFLRSDWNSDENKYQSIPSETMLKLASILSELANILESEHAPMYMSLIGDMRKIKRFVNAVLMMQIEKTNLADTDFNRRDLINLILLNINYPGIFRYIYAEETENRTGIFSITTKRDSGNEEYTNSEEFTKFIDKIEGPGRFLLDHLFSSRTLGLELAGSTDENIRASRACFNKKPYRNLENYLQLIVRIVIPEPRSTFQLYQNAVAKLIAGAPLVTVLSGSNFDLMHGEIAHDQFWRILVDQSYNLNNVAAADSINTLVKLLPHYSLVNISDRGLRLRSIYNLIRLLDRAGWGRTNDIRLPNTPENVVEIARQIYGEGKYVGRGLIERLAAEDRGVLGFYDLFLFRLQCSQDRQGQVHNLHNALIVHDDINAQTSGLTSGLAIAGMRGISQRVFSLFKSRYIDTKKNLFDDIDLISDAALLGDSSDFYFSEAATNGSEENLKHLINATRSQCKFFIVYQLTNRQPGTGAGVGTGYYDMSGIADDGGIADVMNTYLFDVCFNPANNEQNIKHFLDYCLRNLVSGVFSGRDEEGYHPTRQGLVSELNEDMLIKYWKKHEKTIRLFGSNSSERKVFMRNYIATYALDLPAVFEVLDQIKSDKN